MSPRVATIAILAILAAAPRLSADEPLPAPARQPNDSPSSPPQIVVLQNGRILRGHVEKRDKRVRVALGYGDILLRPEEVIAVCNNLDEAYQALARDGDKTIEHHLRLALWCIEQRLFDAAAAEVDQAKAIEPEDPRTAYVARRLKLARQPAMAVNGPTNHPPEKKIVTVEELDRLVRNLPRGTPETFAHTIQPLLVNRCATSGCHAVSSNQALRLLRPPAARGQQARITQRNLHSVLQFVDGEHPEQSRLVQAARGRHAGLSSAVFGDQDQAQVRQLVEWIAAVTGAAPSESAKPAAVVTLKPPPWSDNQLNQLRPPPGFWNQGEVAPASFDEPEVEGEAADSLPDAGPATPAQSAAPTQNPAFGQKTAAGVQAAGAFPAAAPATAPGGDPFDPQVFNRRFGKRREKKPATPR